MELRVLGLIDETHAPFAEPAENPIRPKPAQFARGLRGFEVGRFIDALGRFRVLVARAFSLDGRLRVRIRQRHLCFALRTASRRPRSVALRQLQHRLAGGAGNGRNWHTGASRLAMAECFTGYRPNHEGTTKPTRITTTS